MSIRRTLFWLSCCAALAVSASVNAEDALTTQIHANTVVATTGLVSLARDHQIRVNVANAGICRDAQPVLVRLRDASGNVVHQQRGHTAPGRPLLVEFSGNDVRMAAPSLLQAEVVVGPRIPAVAPPCPVNLTVQTVQGDMQAGPVLNCPGVDICLTGTTGGLVAARRCLPGPPGGFGPQADCSVLNLVLPSPSP